MVEPGEVLAELGRRLRGARRERGLSLAELAVRTGTVKGYLSAIERGRRPPPGAWLAARLERALGLPRGEVSRVSAWWRAGPLRAEVSPWESRGARSGVQGLRVVPGLGGAVSVQVVVDMGASPTVLAGDWVIVGPIGETVSLGLGGFAAIAARQATGPQHAGPLRSDPDREGLGREGGEAVVRGVRVWRFEGIPPPGVGWVMPVLALIKPLAARGSGCPWEGGGDL